MDTCGTCGERNPERARFCLGCGRPLPADREEVRKLVTVLFADVVGSTDLGERYDPEHYREVLTRYFDRLRDVVVHHGGTVEKFIGDAVMAVFGLPVVHEDDALRAVRAAAQIDRTVTDMAAQAAPGELVLRWRIGVNTGEVSAGGRGEHTFATGDAVNLAARLEQAAGPGEIIIGRSTYELVRDAVSVERVPDLEVRGKAAPVVAYRLREVGTGNAGRRRRFDQPFVGRDDELALFEWVVHRATATPAVQLVTVYGAAGTGKTRLVGQALAGRDVRVAWGRCLPYGDGVTYWPLTEALMSAAGIATQDDAETAVRALSRLAGGRVSPADVEAVAATLGLSGGAVDDDPTARLRSYVLGVAGDEGLVLVIDDVHDAEPPLLDLLTSLARARPAPLLVVAIARSELLERRPGWAGGAPNALAVSLEPLGADETAALLRTLLPGPVDAALEARLVAASGGNPLFLEELVTVLVERGELPAEAADRAGDAPRPQVNLPVAIHSLLTARIDALPAEDRNLLGLAAVCGSSFTVEGLAALLGEQDRAAVVDRLEALVDRDLLEPHPSGYAFRHHFARDAVYGGLARRRRAELHERYAAWLDAEASSPQSDEFVAHHLDRALAERTELDPRDPTLTALRATAAERLEAAGQRAFSRGDMRAAARLLGRAVVLASGDRRRAELLAARGRALAETGDFAGADEEFTAALDAAHRSGDEGLATHTRITALWVRSNLDLTGWVDEAERAATEAVDVFTRSGDERGLSRAWGLRVEVRYLLGRYGAAAEALERAGAHARAAGDLDEERANAVAAAYVLLPGPAPLGRIRAACEELATRFPADPSVEARTLQIRAAVAAMQGEFAEARADLAAAVRRFDELGQAYWLAASAVVEGNVGALAGDDAAAEDAWRRALKSFEDLGDRAQAAIVAASLAVHLPGDRAVEVAELAAYAAAHAHPDDLEAAVRSRLADAHLARCTGDLAAAVVAAREAVDRAESSDALVLRADASLALARVAARAGDRAAAAAAAARARDLYAAKGHSVGVGRAGTVTGGDAPPRGAATR